MKKWTKYLFSMLVVFFVLSILNFLIIFMVSKMTHNEKYYVKIGALSEGVIQTDQGYLAEQSTIQKLETMDAFAMLIGEDGNVLWQWNLPEDIKTQYTLQEVAAFSRWYLKDYPVYIWGREDGLFVIGFPKKTVWKYLLQFGLDTIETLLSILPYLLLGNVILLIFLPIGMTKKWIRLKEKNRSEWIAGISHDIRTPLSVVLGNAERGSVIEKQCLKIKELVNNLNTENKLETGTGKWERTEVRIVDVIREIVCDYMNLYGDNYCFSMDLDLKTENMSIIADEALIKRMFENIISNAVSHNAEGCAITIKLLQKGTKHVEITITDDGKGVNSKKIKELNSRLKGDYLPDHGLGLRVVKQIAKKYKYRLTFSSEEGKYFTCKILI